ncbi:MAG TPA: PHP domain-containing protein [Ktedonobacteraceae bacterium]|nr:PHP domain-containing protein [Ktedonobacteraceae bacterium]
MANLVDLHTHSTASDGIYSPGELLHQASDVGLRVLALTDHDSTNGIEEAAQVARTLDIELIPGIEINTDGSGSEIHILGYFPEYQRAAFQHVLQVLRDARVHRGERIVERLSEQGIHINWERVRQLARGAVGRPHIAEALLEAGYVKSIPEAFEKYIGTNCPAYVPRYKLTVEDGIHFIASANGLPVMAHPADMLTSGTLHKWLPGLCAAGMVGLETYYGQYTPDIERELRTLADKYHLIPTGGSDFHGPGIHPTPLGGRYVPYESVERLKAAAAERRGKIPPPFELPPPVQER